MHWFGFIFPDNFSIFIFGGLFSYSYTPPNLRQNAGVFTKCLESFGIVKLYYKKAFQYDGFSLF